MNKFNIYEGVYYSIWLNKFINLFIKKGKKKKIAKHINQSLLKIKLSYNNLPLLYLFEIVESIKPVFELASCFPGRTPIIYPKFINRNKQFILAFRWVKNQIVEEYSDQSRNITQFSDHVFNVITLLASTKNHQLIKKRDQYHDEAVKLQENLRYTWSKL